MGNFLSDNDIQIARKAGKAILISFGLIYFFLSLLMFVFNHMLPAFVNLFLSFVYLLTYKKSDENIINSIVVAIHFVCTIYVIFMVSYFGWGFGAQYFLIPCIAFCYVGQFKNKMNAYILAIIESIIFELLYFFAEVKKYSLNNQIYFNGYYLNDFYYVFHSFSACLVIVGVMYVLKVKISSVITKKENINDILSVNASTDPLTHLINRWAFMEKIRNVKNDSNFHFIIMDIDFFKKINDTYGHSVGDEVLKVTSSLIKKNFSQYTDMIARWGGEEFLIYASDCSADEIYKACDDLKKDLLNNSFNNGSFYATVSVGCVSINGNFVYDKLESYIKKADDLLYIAKNNGRNRLEREISND